MNNRQWLVTLDRVNGWHSPTFPTFSARRTQDAGVCSSFETLQWTTLAELFVGEWRPLWVTWVPLSVAPRSSEGDSLLLPKGRESGAENLQRKKIRPEKCLTAGDLAVKIQFYWFGSEPVFPVSEYTQGSLQTYWDCWEGGCLSWVDGCKFQFISERAYNDLNCHRL